MAYFNQIPRRICLNIKLQITSKIWHMLAEPKLPPHVMCSECTVLAQESDRYRQERQPPSLEAKIFLKCCYKSQPRDIFASLDQSSLKMRSIMQKIDSGEYLKTLHHHTAHHHPTTAFTGDFTI